MTTIISKTVEKLIGQPLINFLEKHGYGNAQWAFRKKSNARDLVTVCVARWVQVCGSCPVCRSPEQARDAWTIFEATREVAGVAETLQEMTQDKFRAHIEGCEVASAQSL